MIKYLSTLLFLSGVTFSAASIADVQTGVLPQSFFYNGLIGGYGEADWSSMVATNTTDGTSLSNPISADGGGPLFGFNMGYQFNPHVAIEAEYVHMSTATIGMTWNLYTITPTTLKSSLSYGAVMLKLIAPISSSGFSFFAEAGPGYQYRSDKIKNVGTFAPLFGGGFMYRISAHWRQEASFQYLPGTGKSVIDPMHYYVPEVYAGLFSLDYLF
jgi:hypothetical protein